MYVGIILLLLLVIVLLSIYLWKLQKAKPETILLARKKEIKELQEQSNNLKRSLQIQRDAADEVLAQVDKRVKEQQQRSADLEQMVWTSLESKIEAHRRAKMVETESQIEKETTALKQKAEIEYFQRTAQLNEEIAKLEEETKSYGAECAEWQKKREAINQDILRQRALEEKQDFFRIILSEDAAEDISTLRAIRQNLHHRENLDKMIYDNYVSKPVLEMVNRVLNGGAPSGIYKITRLKTGEVYIGKSTDVKSRWQQHAKTAFNCGTIAHSILHTTIEKDGIENFTFELIEEVPKDQLTEREKYYINFYGSKQYGLNERNG